MAASTPMRLRSFQRHDCFSLERISYVVGLRQISVVFSVLLGVILLKERQGRQRMLSAVMIFIGVFLIARAG